MTLSFKEDHISQIRALMLLEKLGYTYLTPAEALELRGGSSANVLLEPVLRERIEATKKKTAFVPCISIRLCCFPLPRIRQAMPPLPHPKNSGRNGRSNSQIAKKNFNTINFFSKKSMRS